MKIAPDVRAATMAPALAHVSSDALAHSGDRLRFLKDDLLASVVVFLVALPLCMAIPGASEVPYPALGLITGIIGGLVVGFLAGSPLQVSGPAAGLTVVVAVIVTGLGLPMLGIVLIGAGLLQVVAGALRLGQWFRAVSPAVVEGMLAGIGVLILADQFHVMMDSTAPRGGLAKLAAIPASLRLAFSGAAPHAHAAILGATTIGILLLWRNLAPRKLRLIPAPLLGVLIAALVAYFWAFEVKKVAVPSDPFADLLFPTWANLQRVLEKDVLVAIVTVAFIASAETLLCATAVDQMHSGPRTKYDRELVAQGVGNTLCGLVGALPMTGVIVRSATNVEAGAKTRLATILHGVWLLLALVLLASVLAQVPTACLAAVLVFTGYKLINVPAIRELWAYGRAEVLIFLATMVMVVATNLLEGVLVGVGLSILKLAYTFSHLRIRTETDPAGNHTTLYLEGSATFLRLPQLAAALEQVPTTNELHVRLEGLSYIDHACLELLMSWEKQHEALGGSLVIDWGSLTARFDPRSNHGPGSVNGVT